MKQNLMVFFNTIRFYIVNFMKQNLMVFFNTIRFYFYLVKSDGIEKYQTCGNIYFFSYYNVNGISMARRYWKIPSSSFEVEAIPPPPSASPPEVGGIASTSQDSEDIFQYLLAMLMPLSHCISMKNKL